MDAPMQRQTPEVAGLVAAGFSVLETSEITGLSIRQVEERIEYAIKHGILQCAYSLTTKLEESVSRELLPHCRTKNIRAKLIDLPEANGVDFIVVPSRKEMFTSYVRDEVPTDNEALMDYKSRKESYVSAEAETIMTVSATAAHFVAEGIFNGREHVVGVNWGYVVFWIADHLRKLQPIERSMGQGGLLTWVSLYGEIEFPIYYAIDDKAPERRTVSSNANVTYLEGHIGNSIAERLTVPSFLPAQFVSNPQHRQIRVWLTGHRTYRAIYGSGPPPESPNDPRTTSSGDRANALLHKLDTIITGLGGADNYTDLSNFLSGWLTPEELRNLKELRSAGKIAGDLGGHIFPTTLGNEDEDVRSFLSKINSRLLAARPADFALVSHRHRVEPDSGAGVVATVAGARKAQIVKALLDSADVSPVNTVVLDVHCALALLNLIDETKFAEFRADNPDYFENNEEWSPATTALIPPRSYV